MSFNAYNIVICVLFLGKYSFYSNSILMDFSVNP